MLQESLTELLLIFVLIIANGFFAASEIAVVSARKGRLEQQAKQGHRGARAALRLAEQPDRFLSTVQVGITLIGTFAAAFGGASLAQVIEQALGDFPALAPYASTLALGSVVMLISYMSLIIGELVPKRLALQNAEGVAARMAPVMQLLARLASPIISFLTFSTTLVLRLLRQHNTTASTVTEEDIIALVQEGASGGTVEAAEHDFIRRVFSFTERSVRGLMTPRTQVVAIESRMPFAEVLELATSSGYSRMPVYTETLDTVVGVLHVRDLLQAWDQRGAVDLHTLLRPPLYVIESQRAVMAFQKLKQQRNTLAIVLDEYGQVAGVLSIEDMLEELVGDLSDHDDENGETFVQREDGSYLVDGLLPFADLLARLDMPEGTQLQRAHGFETVAGFVLALMSRVPASGERAEWAGFQVEVLDMDGRRVDKVLIVPPPPRAVIEE